MKQTKLISVSGIKGGSGKTTTALHLAGSLAAERKKVLYLDADGQRSAYDFYRMAENPLFEVIPTDPGELLRTLKKPPQGYDYIFADFPRFTNTDDESTFQALTYLDIILVPVKGTTLDVLSAVKFLEALAILSQENEFRYFAFMSMEERTKDYQTAREIIEKRNHPLLKHSIPKLKALDEPDLGKPIIKQRDKDRFLPFYKAVKKLL